MKVSIVTVCLNSEKTIKHSLNSVISQDYKNIEHIIIDGGSTDKTIKILNNYKFTKKRIFFEKGRSLYDSLNFGIKKCRGDLISILHSDDIYNNNKIISKVVKKSKNSKFKIFFGDVVYFNKNNFNKVTRYYQPAMQVGKYFLMETCHLTQDHSIKKKFLLIMVYIIKNSKLQEILNIFLD